MPARHLRGPLRGVNQTTVDPRATRSGVAPVGGAAVRQLVALTVTYRKDYIPIIREWVRRARRGSPVPVGEVEEARRIMLEVDAVPVRLLPRQNLHAGAKNRGPLGGISAGGAWTSSRFDRCNRRASAGRTGSLLRCSKMRVALVNINENTRKGMSHNAAGCGWQRTGALGIAHENRRPQGRCSAARTGASTGISSGTRPPGTFAAAAPNERSQ
jgi:hypothetical protein